MQLQSALLIVLPILTPLVGSSVAAILAQSKWPGWANDLIAWLILLTIAGGDMYANGQLAGGWFAAIIDAEQAITLLSSGWLVKLDPWLAWLSFLQANIFNLVPLFESEMHIAPTSTQSVTTRATPASVPTPIVMPGSALVPPKSETTPGA